MRLRSTALAIGAVSLAVGVTVGQVVVDLANGPDGPVLPDTVAGTCKTFHNDNVPSIYALVCVPSASPDGGFLLRLWEDGSAGYADGWGIDPDGPDGQGYPQWVAPGDGWVVG